VICYFSSTRFSKPPRYFRMKNNKSFIRCIHIGVPVKCETKSKRNETEQNETKSNKTKRNRTKRNITSFHFVSFRSVSFRFYFVSHFTGTLHIVTFCPTHIRYMNQGIYIYCDFLSYLHTFEKLLSASVICGS
jgi:hypothetical protein